MSFVSCEARWEEERQPRGNAESVPKGSITPDHTEVVQSENIGECARHQYEAAVNNGGKCGEKVGNEDNVVSCDTADTCSVTPVQPPDQLQIEQVHEISADLDVNESFSIGFFNKLMFINSTSRHGSVDTKCLQPNCQLRSLPRSSFCLLHISNDRSQFLFRACKARHRDNSMCNSTITPIGSLYVESVQNCISHLNINLLCEEHRKRAESAEELRLQTWGKNAAIERSRAKHERKLARIEAKRAKLLTKKNRDRSSCNDANKPRPRLSATIRIWKKRRKKTRVTIQTTRGKSLNNVLYRPYPESDVGCSSSQSSSSGSFSDDDLGHLGGADGNSSCCGCLKNNCTTCSSITSSSSAVIKTFSSQDQTNYSTTTEDNHTVPSRNQHSSDLDNNNKLNSADGGNHSVVFDDSVCNAITPLPSPRPPTCSVRHETLTPDLSDDSLQGLQLPACLDSPSLFAFDNENASDSCFSDCIDKFVSSGVFDDFLSPGDFADTALGPSFPDNADASAIKLDELFSRPFECQTGTSMCNANSIPHFQKDLIVVSQSVECVQIEKTILTGEGAHQTFLEMNKDQVENDNQNSFIQVEKNTDIGEQVKNWSENGFEDGVDIGTSIVPSDGVRRDVEKPLMMFSDHTYSSIKLNCATDHLQNVPIFSEQFKIHPNKWLDILQCVPPVNRAEDIIASEESPVNKSRGEEDEKHLDLDVRWKRDPILCQQTADKLNIVRVKFRAPIVVKGGDPNLIYPPKREMKLSASIRNKKRHAVQMLRSDESLID